MTIRIILYEAQITYDFSSIEFVLMNHIELISPFGHLNLLKIFSQAQIAFSQCIAIAIGLGLHIEMIVSPFSLLAVACLSENLATIKSYPAGLAQIDYDTAVNEPSKIWAPGIPAYLYICTNTTNAGTDTSFARERLSLLNLRLVPTEGRKPKAACAEITEKRSKAI